MKDKMEKLIRSCTHENIMAYAELQNGLDITAYKVGKYAVLEISGNSKAYYSFEYSTAYYRGITLRGISINNLSNILGRMNLEFKHERFNNGGAVLNSIDLGSVKLISTNDSFTLKKGLSSVAMYLKCGLIQVEYNSKLVSVGGIQDINSHITEFVKSIHTIN